MRLNPLPFLLAPGVAGFGLVLGGMRGVEVAMGVWLAVIAIATAVAALRRGDGSQPHGIDRR